MVTQVEKTLMLISKLFVYDVTMPLKQAYGNFRAIYTAFLCTLKFLQTSLQRLLPFAV